MAKKGKGLAVVAGVMIVSALGYIGYKLFGGKGGGTSTDDGDDLKEEIDDLKDQLANINTPSSSGGSSSGGSSSGGNRPDDILAFQQWVINTKKNKTILGSGGASGYGDDGLWGSKTAAAWKKYKDAYIKDTTKPTADDQGYLLKSVYNNLQSAYKKKAKFGENSKGIKYLGVVSDNSPYTYWFFETGKVWVGTGENKSIASGKFSNGGKTIKGLTSTKSGASDIAQQTFTDTSPAKAAYKLVTWTDPANKLTYSDNAVYTGIADNIKGATTGGGTYDPILWKNLSKLKTRADFEKVMPIKRGGYTVWKWIKDDLNEIDERKHWNWFLERFKTANGTEVNQKYYFRYGNTSSGNKLPAKKDSELFSFM